MNLATLYLSSLTTVGVILAAMVLVALVEAALPLHARGRWNRTHLAPNLALTAITFGTNAVFNTALVLALVRLESVDFGVLHALALPPVMTAAIAVLALDFSYYVLHVAMHKSPGLWRLHRVHHSDPAVDVTTTIRQHPGESVVRYAFLAVAAIGLGASPGAFAVYRVWSVVNGLLEHANVRMPVRIDSLLSLLVVTPNMHKVHHSRVAAQTDTNYSNIFSLFDRFFRTFIPSRCGVNIVYGLAGFDDPALQTTKGLLASPFRGVRAPHAPAATTRPVARGVASTVEAASA